MRTDISTNPVTESERQSTDEDNKGTSSEIVREMDAERRRWRVETGVGRVSVDLVVVAFDVVTRGKECKGCRIGEWNFHDCDVDGYRRTR